MMQGNEPAFPTTLTQTADGITKRELMAAIIAGGRSATGAKIDHAKTVIMADELITALNRRELNEHYSEDVYGSLQELIEQYGGARVKAVLLDILETC